MSNKCRKLAIEASTVSSGNAFNTTERYTRMSNIAEDSTRAIHLLSNRKTKNPNLLAASISTTNIRIASVKEKFTSMQDPETDSAPQALSLVFPGTNAKRDREEIRTEENLSLTRSRAS
jgi:hypothetical protein